MELLLFSLYYLDHQHRGPHFVVLFDTEVKIQFYMKRAVKLNGATFRRA